VAFSQKRALKEGRTIVFADQSGFYLLPAVVRTYAHIGQTPYSMNSSRGITFR
jgi:hypothetical protein